MRVFKSSEKGKDRYSKFQVQWHKYCSLLLMDKIDESSEEVFTLHGQWLKYCEGCGVARKVYNPVMISLCSAVYDYLMREGGKTNTGKFTHPGRAPAFCDWGGKNCMDTLCMYTPHVVKKNEPK